MPTSTDEPPAPDERFLDLIERVRDGDQQAASQLVERYGPQLRRIVRVRLSDARLRRVMDSQDICQSVMANFFVRAMAGQFELDSPEQLFKLLATMARNKVTNKAEYYQAGRRDVRRNAASGDAMNMVSDSQTTPSVIMARDEVIARLKSLLSDEERLLFNQRAEGRSWKEIASETGDNPDRLRKALSRATERIAAELGMHEEFDA